MIGGINTAIDFTVLFSLRALGFPILPANIISTFCAFCFSFFANKKFTFKTNNSDIKRELVLFTIVTLFGLWVVQGIVIQLITFILSNTPLPESIALLVAKIFATIASLTWNYTLYSRFVFLKKS